MALELHDPGAAWTSSATWLTKDGTNPWPTGTVGGAPGTTKRGSGTLAPNGGTVTLGGTNLANLVGGWINSPGSNKGLVLMAVTETQPGPGFVPVATAGNSVELSRPNLTITYNAPPDAPTLTASRGDRSIGLSWTPPVNNGSPVTGYTIRTYEGSTLRATTPAGANDTFATVNGLTNGLTYHSTITATNSIGTSAVSQASNDVVPAGVPFTPMAVSASRADQSATVTWTAPGANGAAISGYRIAAYAGSTLVSTTSVGAVTSATVAGLSNGTAYTFTVAATNDVGTGLPSAATSPVTPAGVPTAPTAVSAVQGLGSAEVSWTAASPNGDGVTSNTIRAYDGATLAGTTTVGAVTHSTVGGLSNGTAYTFTVTATNTVGSGAPSSASAATTVGTPLVPTSLNAIAADRQVQLSWTPPADNGVTVESYLLRAYRDGTLAASTTIGAPATTGTVTGLTNGLGYAVTVTANSSVGSGPESAASSSTSPFGAPLAPAQVTATAGDGQASLSWSAADSNGSPLIGYTVTTYTGATFVGTQTLGLVNATTITGLQNGTGYRFEVAARNAAGVGAATTSASVTPAGVPMAPATLTGVAGDGEVSLSWSPADGNGSAVSGYVVQTWHGSTQVSTTDLGPVTSATVTGLHNGTSYTFTVAGINTVGTGNRTTSSAITPAGLPFAPSNVVAARGDQQATLSWTAAEGNGSAVTSYAVRTFHGTTLVSVTYVGEDTATVITGLTNGVGYTFTVAAINTVGSSAETTPTSTVIPAGVPAAPASVTAARGDGQATVTWTAAVPNGDPITGYTVTAYAADTQVATTEAGAVTSGTLTGLTNGVAYRFTVAATNTIGTGAGTTSALVTPAGVPFAPTNVSATPGNTQAGLSWTPADANGDPVTGYYVIASGPDGPVGTLTVAAGSSGVTYLGLSNGTSYTFQVFAINSVGSSIASEATSAITPAGAPLAPGTPTATRGDTQVSLTWAAADNNGRPVTGNTIRVYHDSTVVSSSTVGAVTSATITGLTNGTSYSFTVSASNALGEGDESNASDLVVPAGLPAAPTTVTGIRGDTQAVITWTAPDSNGDAVTGYAVTASDGTSEITTHVGAVTSATITGLTNGTVYTFTVAATNTVGTSPASAPSAPLKPAGVPFAPSAVTANAGDQQAAVTWTAPDGNGEPITSYTITASAAGTQVSTTTVGAVTNATITGLANGTAYTFAVAATNSVGTGASASTSGSVTPAGAPFAAAAPTATRGDTTATVAWAPPNANGTAITGYTLRAYTGGVLAATTTAAGSSTTGTVTGLVNGTAYTFTVRATNAAGEGPESSASTPVTPAGNPFAPTGIVALAGDAKVNLSWSPSNDNGSTVTSYTVAVYTYPLHTQGASSVSATGTQATIAGLSNGVAYTFEISATNAVGTGPAGISSNVTPTYQNNLNTVIGTGQVSTVAGSGSAVTAAGTGTAAGFNAPHGVAVVAGFAYVAGADAVSKVNLGTGQVSVLAGLAGTSGCTDATSGSAARISASRDLATDGTYAYLVDGCGVRRVALSTGAVSTLASGSGYGGVTVSPDGSLYITQTSIIWGNHYANMYRLNPSTGQVTQLGSASSYADAGAIAADATYVYWAAAQTIYRYTVSSGAMSGWVTDAVLDTNSELESAGSYLYVGTLNPTGARGALRRYAKADGKARIVAGSGSAHADGVGADAWFNGINDLATDGTNIWVADAGNYLRKVAPTSDLPSGQQAAVNAASAISSGAVSTVAGSGSAVTAAGTGTAAGFNAPHGVVVVGGFAYVADADAVSKMDLGTGQVSVLAGLAGTSGCTDAVSGSAARISSARDLATDGYYGYLADGCGVRRVSLSTGAVSTLVTGSGYTGVTVGPDGFLYLTQTTIIWGNSYANLLRLDPKTNQTSLLSMTDRVAVAGGVAADASYVYWVSSATIYTSSAVIYRYTVSTGANSVWVTEPALDTNSELESAGNTLYVALAGGKLVHYNKVSPVRAAVAGGASGSGAHDDEGVYARFGSIGDLASDGTRVYIADATGNTLRLVGQSTWSIDDGQAVGFDADADFQQDVNPGLGSFTTSATDAAISTVGPALTVNRSYNSADPNDTGFGVGWTTDLGMGWEPDADGNIVILRGDGRRDIQTANGNGTFSPPPGNAGRLTADGSGGFLLTETDGTVYALSGSSRKLTSVTDPAGHVETYSYNGAGQLASVTSASGRHLIFGWTSGHVTSVATDAVNGSPLTWTYSYNTSNGNTLLASVCDPRGTGADHCTLYDYAAGLLTRIRRPLGTTSATIGYNPDGSVQFREDGLGHYTSFSYPDPQHPQISDPSNNTTTQTVDGSLRLTAETDSAGHTQSFGYDSRGFRNTVTDENGATTTAAFDPRGNALTTTDATGHTAHSTYDSANNLLTQCDERSATQSDSTYCTVYTYDGLHHKLSQKLPATAAFPSGVTRYWTYTTGTESAIGGGSMPSGLLRSETDYRGNVTQYSYTAAGDLAETLAPLGQRTTNTYDALGRKLTETVYSSTFPAGVTTSWTYDGLGSMLTQTGPAVTNPVTGVTHQLRTTNSYDANENLTSVTQSDVTGGDASRTSSYAYDSLDRQVSSTDDQTGASMTRAYDSLGNVVSVTDQLGRLTTTTYDQLNRPIAVIQHAVVDDPIGGSTPHDVTLAQTSYDAAGQVLSETDALGHTRVNAYDSTGRLSSVTLSNFVNPNGSTRSIVLSRKTYDAAGQLVDDYSGSDLRHVHNTYDAAGRLTSTVLDPGGLNRTTSYSYDADGNTLSTVLTDGQRTETTSHTYDANNDVLSTTVTTGIGTLLTTATYDTRGIQLGSTDPRGNVSGADPVAYTTNMTSDELGRPVTVALPPVLVETAGGTPSSTRPTSTTGYDTFGNVTQTRDANGNTTTSSYDKLNRKTAVSYPAYTAPTGGTVTPTESWTFDAVGNQLSHTDRRGQLFSFTFDSRNRVVAAYDPLLDGQASRGVTRTSYDEAGQKTASIDQDGATTRWSYDTLSRTRTQTGVIRQAGSASLDATTTYGYDDLGNQTSVQDPAGNTTSSTFNPAGEQLTSTDPAGNTTTYTYDVAGRQINTLDPLGRRTSTTFDLAGRQTAQNRYDHTGALLTTTSSGYDPAGNLTSQTNARGYTTTMAYDVANRLSSVTTPGGHGEGATTTAGYDANGNMTRFTDANNHTTLRTYTSGNQLESTVEPATTGQTAAADRTWTTSYDTGALPVAETQPGGVSISRSFDNLGRLLTETGTGTGLPTATRSFGYDLAGRRTTLAASSGTDTFSYDDRGLLTAATGPSGTATFGFDLAGRLTSRTDAAGTSTFSYTARSQLATATDPLTHTTRINSYDVTGQLTSTAMTAAGSTGSTRTYAYDDLGRLTSDQLATATGAVTAAYGYGYDANGSITSRSITLPNNPGNGTHTYTYDQEDRLSSWTTPGGATTSYGWDAAGNRLQAGSDAFTYDQRNRLLTGPDGTNAWSPNGNLTATTNGGGAQATYSYDALSRLAGANTVTGQTVSYSYDSLDRLTDRNGTALGYAGTSIKPVSDGNESFARGLDDALLAVSDGTNAWIAGTDRHHDLTYLAQPDATISGNRVYDPFGTVESSAGTISTSLGFQSDLTDAATGDVWMGARWYDPSTAEFLTQDTVTGEVTDPESLNRYTYVNGDPLNFFDPSGHVNVAVDGQAHPDQLAQYEHMLQRISQINMAFSHARGTSYLHDLGTSVTGTFDGLTFGLTKSARREFGIEDSALYDSAVYRQSHLGGTLAGVVLTVLDGGPAILKAPAFARKLSRFPELIRAAGGIPNLTRKVAALAKRATSLRLGLAAGSAVRRAPQVLRVGNVKLSAVPRGAVGIATKTGKGLEYAIPRGTPELSRRVASIRIMDPVKNAKYVYPKGYAVYMNAQGQRVNPLTGQMIHDLSDFFAHIPLP